MTAWRVICECCGPLGAFTDLEPRDCAKALADSHEAATLHSVLVDPPTASKE